MKASEAVKSVMAECNITQAKLAEMSKGKWEQTNITGILNRGTSMRVSNLVEMMEMMGFEVVVRDKRDESRIIRIDG